MPAPGKWSAIPSASAETAIGDSAGKGKKAIEEFFSPEFRNRLDDIINFRSLDINIMEQVVDKFMDELVPQLAVKKVEFPCRPRPANGWPKRV
jgi:ATP-dependent Clp protease ATP-binding subunit ClpA